MKKVLIIAAPETALDLQDVKKFVGALDEELHNKAQKVEYAVMVAGRFRKEAVDGAVCVSTDVNTLGFHSGREICRMLEEFCYMKSYKPIGATIYPAAKFVMDYFEKTEQFRGGDKHELIFIDFCHRETVFTGPQPHFFAELLANHDCMIAKVFSESAKPYLTFLYKYGSIRSIRMEICVDINLLRKSATIVSCARAIAGH